MLERAIMSCYSDMDKNPELENDAVLQEALKKGYCVSNSGESPLPARLNSDSDFIRELLNEDWFLQGYPNAFFADVNCDNQTADEIIEKLDNGYVLVISKGKYLVMECPIVSSIEDTKSAIYSLLDDHDFGDYLSFESVYDVKDWDKLREVLSSICNSSLVVNDYDSVADSIDILISAENIQNAPIYMEDMERLGYQASFYPQFALTRKNGNFVITSFYTDSEELNWSSLEGRTLRTAEPAEKVIEYLKSGVHEIHYSKGKDSEQDKLKVFQTALENGYLIHVIGSDNEFNLIKRSGQSALSKKGIGNLLKADEDEDDDLSLKVFLQKGDTTQIVKALGILKGGENYSASNISDMIELLISITFYYEAFLGEYNRTYLGLLGDRFAIFVTDLLKYE